MQPISNTNHPCTNPEIAVNMQRNKHHIEITLDSGFNLYCFFIHVHKSSASSRVSETVSSTHSATHLL